MTTRDLVYEIQVDGHLDDHWAGWIGRSAAARNDDGTTTFVAGVADQAQLHGVLTGLRDIGATLLSLRTVDPHDQTDRGGLDRSHTPETPSLLRRRLTTERLVLRPATLEDADITWRYRKLPGVNEWLTGAPEDVSEYRTLFADPERLATTVIVELRHGPAAHVIGDFMLKREDAWAQIDVRDSACGQQAELGWVLDPEYSGHGYATEASRALLRYCFADLEVRRVVASCFLDNVQSWRLMERLGMRRETHSIRDALHRRDAWLDSVTYALLADEWAET